MKTTEERHREQIGSRMRQARESARLTQVQVADLLAVTQGMISQYERGIARPDNAALKALAKATGRTLQWFLLGDLPADSFLAKARPEAMDRAFLAAESQSIEARQRALVIFRTLFGALGEAAEWYDIPRDDQAESSLIELLDQGALEFLAPADYHLAVNWLRSMPETPDAQVISTLLILRETRKAAALQTEFILRKMEVQNHGR